MKIITTEELIVFAKELKKKLDNKISYVEGKTLTSNDFTDELKEKLENVDAHEHDNKEVLDTITQEMIEGWNSGNGGTTSSFQGSWNDLTDKPNIPQNISDLNDDSDFIDTTELEVALRTKADKAFVLEYEQLHEGEPIPDGLLDALRNDRQVVLKHGNGIWQLTNVIKNDRVVFYSNVGNSFNPVEGENELPHPANYGIPTNNLIPYFEAHIENNIDMYYVDPLSKKLLSLESVSDGTMFTFAGHNLNGYENVKVVYNFGKMTYILENPTTQDDSDEYIDGNEVYKRLFEYSIYFKDLWLGNKSIANDTYVFYFSVGEIGGWCGILLGNIGEHHDRIEILTEDNVPRQKIIPIEDIVIGEESQISLLKTNKTLECLYDKETNTYLPLVSRECSPVVIDFEDGEFHEGENTLSVKGQVDSDVLFACFGDDENKVLTDVYFVDPLSKRLLKVRYDYSSGIDWYADATNLNGYENVNIHCEYGQFWTYTLSNPTDQDDSANYPTLDDYPINYHCNAEFKFEGINSENNKLIGYKVVCREHIQYFTYTSIDKYEKDLVTKEDLDNIPIKRVHLGTNPVLNKDNYEIVQNWTHGIGYFLLEWDGSFEIELTNCGETRGHFTYQHDELLIQVLKHKNTDTEKEFMIDTFENISRHFGFYIEIENGVKTEYSYCNYNTFNENSYYKKSETDAKFSTKEEVSQLETELKGRDITSATLEGNDLIFKNESNVEKSRVSLPTQDVSGIQSDITQLKEE